MAGLSLASPLARAALFATLLAALTSASVAEPAAAPAQPSHWLRCGALWDGRGGPTRGPVLIEIRGDRIGELRSADGVPPAGPVTDLAGLTCCPASSTATRMCCCRAISLRRTMTRSC